MRQISSPQISIRILSVSLALAFLLSLLTSKNGNALPGLQGTMPTPDRLLEPTLPAIPSQADYGAQVYWLSCLPCHGDRGQGLTDEFRETYPPEDRNCWKSGCHGERPYEHGFKLPPRIPAIIGGGTLQRFRTAAALQAYILAAMPYWKPGSLTNEQAWQVTAFLLRENGLLQKGITLGPQNAAEIFLPVSEVTATPTHPAARNRWAPENFWVLGGLILAASLGGYLGYRWLRRNSIY
jgi:mono/diheme cytochrome c family protein